MRITHSNPDQPGGGLETLEPRLLFCATSAITADLASSLDAWWRFDDPGVSTIDDSSGSVASHPGTLNGAANVSAIGLCGGSGVFAGGEMNVANHNDINLGTHGQRTIALWFLAEDVDAPGRQLLYEEGGGTRGLNIYLDGGELVVGGWNRNESGWQGTWLSTGAVTSGQWHHVVLTLDGGATTQPGALRGYIDSGLFGVGEGSQLWSHSGDITIGGVGDTLFPDGSVGAVGFIGRIDDMRLYNRALAAHDVAVLSGRFNEGAAIILATHWRDDLATLLGFASVEDVPEGRPLMEDGRVAVGQDSRPETDEPSAESHAAPGTDQAPEPVMDSASAEVTLPGPVVSVEPAEGQHSDSAQEGAAEGEDAPHATLDPRIAEVETDPKQSGKPSTPPDVDHPFDAPYGSDAARDSGSQPRPPLARDDGRSGSK